MVGAIIEEAQGHQDQNNYISERKCSRARSFLVLKWALLGFLLTISYKSVLRSMMMKVEYEDTIDTVDDLLASGRMFLLTNDTSQKYLFLSDPREKVIQLRNKTQYYNLGSDVREMTPPWVRDG